MNGIDVIYQQFIAMYDSDYFSVPAHLSTIPHDTPPSLFKLTVGQLALF